MGNLLDFVSGPFRGQKSVFACLAYHLSLNWKDTDILKELYNILVYNKRSIRDRIAKQQEELHLSATKGKLPNVEFCGFFDDEEESGKIKDSNTLSSSNHLNHQVESKSNIKSNLNVQDKKTSTPKEIKRNSIQKEMKRNSIQKEMKRNSIQKERKRNSIQKEMKRNSIPEEIKRNSISKEMKKNSSVVIKSDLSKSFIDESKYDKKSSVLTTKDLGGDILSRVTNKNAFENDIQTSIMIKKDYANDIDRIMQFIKSNCTDDHAKFSIESAKKVLSNTNIKYQIEHNRSYKKKKEIIDHEVHLAKNIIKTSQDLVKKAKNTIHTIQEIRQEQALKI